MSDPTFGISITRIDNEPRPAVWSDMSVVGLIGTAPAADAAAFPLDTPVFMYSDDAVKRTALGTSGTIPEALSLINAQLGEFQVAAKVVVVRVAEGAVTIGPFTFHNTSAADAAEITAQVRAALKREVREAFRGVYADAGLRFA